jgi:hypothetical protein
MALNVNKIVDCPSLDAWRTCFIDAPPSMNTLRHAFTTLLKWAYANAVNKDSFSDALGCLVFDTDPSKSQISIQSSSALDPGDTENVPGIIVSCDQGIKFERQWISSEGAASPDFASNERLWLAHASIKFVCRHYDADVACMMSDFTTMFLTAMEPVLYETFNWILDYKPAAQTEPTITQKTQTEDAAKWYESTVNFELNYRYSVFVARESKRLKDFSLVAKPKPGEITLDS